MVRLLDLECGWKCKQNSSSSAEASQLRRARNEKGKHNTELSCPQLSTDKMGIIAQE